MGAALRDWNNMMYFLHGRQPAFLEAHLTQGMLRSVAVAYALPGASVFLVYVRRAFVFVVLLPFRFAVSITVLSVCKVGASGVGTRSLWFAWHLVTSCGTAYPDCI